MLGLTIATLAMLAASVRVIGWILVAATFAGLLHPVVKGLERWMRHGLALIVVVLACIAVAGFLGYRVVDDINTQLHELQHALPKAARSIEHSDRFGKSAREIHLAAKVGEFVDQRADDRCQHQRDQGAADAVDLEADHSDGDRDERAEVDRSLLDARLQVQRLEQLPQRQHQRRQHGLPRRRRRRRQQHQRQPAQHDAEDGDDVDERHPHRER
jgi:hypothetical protein